MKRQPWYQEKTFFRNGRKRQCENASLDVAPSLHTLSKRVKTLCAGRGGYQKQYLGPAGRNIQTTLKGFEDPPKRRESDLLGTSLTDDFLDSIRREIRGPERDSFVKPYDYNKPFKRWSPALDRLMRVDPKVRSGLEASYFSTFGRHYSDSRRASGTGSGSCYGTDIDFSDLDTDYGSVDFEDIVL